MSAILHNLFDEFANIFGPGKLVIHYDDLCDIEIDGIKKWDAPKFCDAYISRASYKKRDRDLTEAELELLNEDTCFVHEQVYKKLY